MYSIYERNILGRETTNISQYWLEFVPLALCGQVAENVLKPQYTYALVPFGCPSAYAEYFLSAPHSCSDSQWVYLVTKLQWCRGLLTIV